MNFEKLNQVFNKVKLNIEDFDTLFSFKELRENYIEHVKDIHGRRAKFGIPSIDYALYGGVKPGYIAGIVGETDIGKTIAAQHISFCNAKAMPDLITLFSSQETPAFDLYERAMQTHFDESSIEVEQGFQQNKFILKESESLNKTYENLYSIVKRASITDLYYYILAVEHITRKHVGTLIIDWLGMVPHKDYRNSFDRIENNMLELDEVCLHHKIPAFLLLQINKAEGRGEKETGLHSAKGPSIIEQVCKIFITINNFPVSLKSDLPEDIQKAWDNNLIKVLKFSVKKKKYGLSKPEVVVLQNKKSLELVEYNPNYSYHIEFMNKLKQSREHKDLFEEPI